MKKEKLKESGPSVSELKPWPSYIQERLALWEKLKSKYDQELATKTSVPIKVTLPDGKQIDAASWKTTPYDVAKGIRLNFF